MSGNDKRQSAKRGAAPIVTSSETSAAPSGPITVSQVSLGSVITLSSGKDYSIYIVSLLVCFVRVAAYPPGSRSTDVQLSSGGSFIKFVK